MSLELPAAMAGRTRYLALCGGVGGAKLALGLSHVLSAEQLTIVVNTGDDFEHLGLTICPDLDTVTYTLARLVHPVQGWGRDAESYAALQVVGELGEPTWFSLGDKDIGLHLVRRALLEQGLTLSEVTARIARRLGVAHPIVPMTDGSVRTMIGTAGGLMPFQHYFVKQRCAPAVTAVHYVGASEAEPSPALAQALAGADLAGVIVCPSNPYLSIDPILALPGVRRMLADARAPVVAVAPLVRGEAIKGPTAKIMRELAVEPTAEAVARHYADFLDAYLADPADAMSIDGLQILHGNIVMASLSDKIELARRCVALIDQLAGLS